MKTKKLSFLIIIFSLLTLFLSSCGPTKYPERLATLDEVFPPQSIKSLETQADPGAIKRKTFPAPYEDVFRAARVSAAQTQFEVQKESRDEGIILAVKKKDLGPGGTKHQFILILVMEKGSESTEVISMVKEQWECIHYGIGDSCPRGSVPHWINGDKYLSQFFVFIDNNLIAAGVI